MKPAAAMASLTHERGRNFRHITGTHIAPGSQLARARSFLFAKRVKRVRHLGERQIIIYLLYDGLGSPSYGKILSAARLTETKSGEVPATRSKPQEIVTMIWPAFEKFGADSPAVTAPADCRELKWSMPTDRYMVWIDGVGAWQLCVGSQFLIGGPTLEDTSADICLMANLSRRHASLLRKGEDWFIHPHQSTVVSGRAVNGPTLLRTGDEICLAERVRLGFRIPSVLAGSAVIDFESHHRPAQSVNGIILMTDSILLGPRKDHHVCCQHWQELVVIYNQDGGLRCRSKAALNVNGTRVRDSALLTDGAIVSGDDFRFRIERLKT